MKTYTHQEVIDLINEYIHKELNAKPHNVRPKVDEWLKDKESSGLFHKRWIWVKNNNDPDWKKAQFSHLENTGKIRCYVVGTFDPIIRGYDEYSITNPNTA